MKFTMHMDSDSRTSFAAGKDIIYTGAGYSASFQCSYPIDITVTSAQYNVEAQPSPSTPFISTGSLTSRFKITLAGVDGDMVLGSKVNAKVEWDSALAALSGVTMYVYQCQVKTGAVDVKLLKAGCYSKQLSAKPGPATSDAHAHHLTSNFGISR